MKSAPLHSRIVLVLALLLPAYFAAAALGTKFGFWGWKTGLGLLTITAGPVLIGVVALAALISLIIALRRKPRSGWALSAIALAIPLAIFGSLIAVRSKAADIPAIHDVATDTANPPAFSGEKLAARDAAGANPLNDYQTPLGQLEPWKSADPALASRSHAQVIGGAYPDLAALPLGTVGRDAAVAAVEAAMQDMGFGEVVADREAGTVEGVAETFWFGFKDDVVVRIADDRIDFRSVSRVGLSDLGANAERIETLRAKVAERIGS